MLKFIGGLVVRMIDIYLFILSIRIIVSWLNIKSHNSLLDILHKITDPVLNYFREHTPIRVGSFDLSVIVPFMLLGLVKQIIVDLIINSVPFSIYYVIKLALGMASGIITFVALIFIGICIVLIIMRKTSRYTVNPIINSMYMFLEPFLAWLRRNIKVTTRDPDTIYLVILIGIAIGTLLGTNFLMEIVIGFVHKLEVNALMNKPELPY